jgi:hypothetical protein
LILATNLSIAHVAAQGIHGTVTAHVYHLEDRGARLAADTICATDARNKQGKTLNAVEIEEAIPVLAEQPFDAQERSLEE